MACGSYCQNILSSCIGSHLLRTIIAYMDTSATRVLYLLLFGWSVSVSRSEVCFTMLIYSFCIGIHFVQCIVVSFFHDLMFNCPKCCSHIVSLLYSVADKQVVLLELIAFICFVNHLNRGIVSVNKPS